MFEKEMLAELRRIRLAVETQKAAELQPQHCTVSEAARLLCRSKATIRRWIAEQRLTAVKLGEGKQNDRLMIERKSVEKILRTAKV